MTSMGDTVAGETPPLAASATIGPHVVRSLVRFAAERGVVLERTLREIGLSGELLDAPRLRVSFRQGQAIIEAAIDALVDPALGVTVGSRQAITALGPLGLGMMASPRFGDAIELALHYQRLAGSMLRWRTERIGGRRAVTVATRSGIARIDAFLVDAGMANFTRMARDVFGPQFRPAAVELARARPSGAEEFERWHGIPVRFGASRDAWMLRPDQWTAPNPHADPWTAAEISGLLDAELADAEDRQELVAALSARIERGLPATMPLAAHARALAMSERTLRRRLEELQTGYTEVVDEVRRRVATRLLRRGATAAQVAAAIGYADERSLRRATQRWFGVTPAHVRRGQADPD